MKGFVPILIGGNLDVSVVLVVAAVNVLVNHVTHLPGLLLQGETTDKIDGTLMETQ